MEKGNLNNIYVSYKTFCFNNLWNHSDRYLDHYLNTQMLFGVPKKLNTKYKILFGIEIIWIPNSNTTIWSNYLNSIRIPKYSSHPVLGPSSNRGLRQRLGSSWERGGHIALDIKSHIFLRLLSYPAVSTSVCCVLMIVSLKQSQISSSKVWEFPASIS